MIFPLHDKSCFCHEMSASVPSRHLILCVLSSCRIQDEAKAREERQARWAEDARRGRQEDEERPRVYRKDERAPDRCGHGLTCGLMQGCDHLSERMLSGLYDTKPGWPQGVAFDQCMWHAYEGHAHG